MNVKQLVEVSAQQEKFQTITLSGDDGVAVVLSSSGATLCKWMVPDRTGKLSSVVLGYEDIDSLRADTSYLGCTVGRVANRIGKARYLQDGREISLSKNDGENQLHGGKSGFSKKNWKSETGKNFVRFDCVSGDGEEGFPGQVSASVKYTLENSQGGGSRLRIEYRAEVSAKTPVSLTNHAYFNLSNAETILQQSLTVDADLYTPVDAVSIPTGEIRAVKGTPFDLTTAKKLSDIIVQRPEGIDHNYVLRSPSLDVPVAKLKCEDSGRELRVFTTEPGLQIYTGNFLNAGTVTTRGPAEKYGAVCLETQRFPDFVNHSYFPGFFAEPGVPYVSETIYEISVS